MTPRRISPSPAHGSDADVQRLQRILHHLPVVLFELDAETRLTLIEGYGLNQASSATAELVGKTAREISQMLTIPDFDATLRRLYAGESVEFTVGIGDEWFETRAQPIMGAKGRLEGAVGVTFNASARHRAQEALSLSEARYRAMIDNIEDGYYEVDLSGKFTSVNDALCRMLGYPAEELVSGQLRSFRSVTPSEDADRAQRAFNHVYKTGKPMRSIEGRARRSDGREIVVELSVSLRHDAHGAAAGFRGIVRDITDRKAVEEALAQRMVLLSVLEQVDQELSQTLELDKVLMVALNAASVLSSADLAFIGLVEGDAIRIVRSTSQTAGAVGRTLAMDHGVVGRAMRLRQGQYVPDVAQDKDYRPDVAETVSQIAVPLIVHDRLLGVLNVETTRRGQFTEATFEYVQMLTARIASAVENARLFEQNVGQLEELRKLYGQVTQLEQLKTDMIRIASHDLRSPLGIIVGYLDILTFDLEPVLSEEQIGYFDAMRRAAERIQRMSTEILSLERVNTLANQPRVTVSLNDLVLRTLVDYRDAARQKDINLITQLETQPLHVMADIVSLPEAIDNLVSNAIKYTPAGGFVTVKVARDGGQRAIVDVIDTGLGIREESQSRLFEPFYRVKSEETARIDGTGLGLYLVKRIIEQHGGEMHFRSTFGQGSQFGFTLPLAGESA